MKMRDLHSEAWFWSEVAGWESGRNTVFFEEAQQRSGAGSEFSFS
jgi:hypothetical protein